MNAHVLMRAGGAAALIGGLARMAGAFPLPLDAVSLEALWTATDIFLTLGLIGVYLVRAEKLGLMGFAGFVIAMAALSFIGGPDADPFGFSTYEQGAAVLVIALVGLSIAWLRAGERPLWPPLCWFGCALVGGLFSYLPAPMPSFGFPAAGFLFGAGFAAAGLDLLMRKA